PSAPAPAAWAAQPRPRPRPDPRRLRTPPAARATPGRASHASRQVLLDERRAQVHVELDQRPVPDAPEAVHLARLDDEDVARAGLELLAVHRPQAAALLDE